MRRLILAAILGILAACLPPDLTEDISPDTGVLSPAFFGSSVPDTTPWSYSEPLTNPTSTEVVFFFFGDSNTGGTAERDSVSFLDSLNVSRFNIWRSAGAGSWAPVQLGFNTNATDAPGRTVFGLEASFLLSHLDAVGVCDALVIKGGVSGHDIVQTGHQGDQSIHPDYVPIAPNPPVATAPNGQLDTLNQWETWGAIQANRAFANLRAQGIEPEVYLIFTHGYNDGALNQGVTFDTDLPSAIAGYERDLDINEFAGVILPELSHRSVFPSNTAAIIDSIHLAQYNYALSNPDKVKIFSTCDATMKDDAHWNTAGTWLVGELAYDKFEEF